MGPGCLLSVSPAGMQSFHQNCRLHYPMVVTFLECRMYLCALGPRCHHPKAFLCVCRHINQSRRDWAWVIVGGGCSREPPSKLEPRLHCLFLSDPPPLPTATCTFLGSMMLTPGFFLVGLDFLCDITALAPLASTRGWEEGVTGNGPAHRVKALGSPDGIVTAGSSLL